MLKFIERPRTLDITSRKTWLSLKKISCLQVIFVLIWMKQTLYGSIYKEMELEMDCLTSRTFLQKACGCKCQFCTKICPSSRLASHVFTMAGQNIKKKYLMCLIPIKMLKQHAFPNSSLHNVKIYSSKGCRKTSPR